MISIELAIALNNERNHVFGSYLFAPDMAVQVLRMRAELEQEINADIRKNA
ncbi:hypothetical protein FOL01_0127 [Weissella jogaejeotgali]|uniref:Uncharacterized protein n=1 Tax=Weissella jogaejeotgali TaxID=1631871 RepID=A0A1L6R8W7_9LACO|nr:MULTISPECIES: hypothetical protein [Weissella]APS40986.1 hypothetical protein FOL01_0127 [Weissella jogaejeotgali]